LRGLHLRAVPARGGAVGYGREGEMLGPQDPAGLWVFHCV